MIKESVQKAIVVQIKNEEHSSRLYMYMASWCQANGYPGKIRQSKTQGYGGFNFFNLQPRNV